MRRLGPLRRACLTVAVRRVRARARRERDEFADETLLDDIRVELRAMRNEFARLQMIDDARDEHQWLH